MKRLRWLAALLAAASVGCQRKLPEPTPPAGCETARWFDDANAGFACASALKKPVLLELWAPWCHTCLSMKETVLTDRRLRPYFGRFVLIALDTDRPESGPAVARFPPVAWPTLFVIHPAGEPILARLVGGATVEELLALLDDGEAAVSSEGQDKVVSSLLSAAHEAEAKRDHERAGALYDEALAAAPAGSTRRPELLLSRIRAHHRAGDAEACVAFAAHHGKKTGKGPAAADFAFYADACARRLPDPSVADPAIDAIVRHLTEALGDDNPLSVDDKSEGLRILREIHLRRGEPKEARTLAERQRDLLDRAMEAAKTPREAMTHSWPAAEVHAFLGEPEAFIPALERLVAALPEEYDPPYRLAWLLLEAGRAKDALPPVELARARVYGPRAADVLGLEAKILSALGRGQEAKKRRVEALDLLEALPAGAVDPAKIQAARAAADRLGADPAPASPPP